MKRWFSFALVVTMCLTTVFGDVSAAFAEDDLVVSEAIEAQILEEATQGDIDLIGPETALSEEEPSVDGGLTVQNEEEQAVETDADQVVIEGEDAPENAEDANDSHTLWYARARASLTLEVDEAISRTIPAGSVLLVTETAGEGLVRVACGNLSGVVDETALEALSEEDLNAFMDAIAAMETVTLYQERLEYPLPPEPTEDGKTDADDAPATPDEAGENTVEDAPDEAPSDGEAEEAADDGEAVEDAVIPEENEDAFEPETQPEGENASETAQNSDESDADAEGEGSIETDNSRPDDEAENAEENANAEQTVVPEAVETVETIDEGEEAAVEALADTTVLTEADTAEKAGAGFEAGVAASIALNATSLNLGVKEIYADLTATVVDAGGAPVEGVAVNWASSNSRVVRVNAEGRLTAVRRGKATIVVSAEGLPQATVTVIVKDAPTRLTVTPKKSNMGLGMTLQLTAKVDKGAASGKLTYMSGNPAVATVDANGLVTAVAPGSATITIRTFNKKKATCKVAVYGEPAAIATEKASYAILQGRAETIVTTVTDAGGARTYANLTFESSDPNCATVDAAGRVTGVNIGSATITVTTQNGLSASCTVDVCGLPADMTLSAETITIGVKEKYKRMSYTLIPPEGQTSCTATVKWKSKNKKIAKVNAKTGVITGVKAGTTTIIATTSNNISKQVKVVVKKAPKSLTLSPTELPLTPGMTGQLSTSYDGKSNNDNMTYTSSDPSVATVDENGLVTALGRGTAVITATSYNKKSASCTVSVYEQPAQVFITPEVTLAVGMSEQVDCSVVDAEGQPSQANYTFSTVSDTGTIEVDDSGRVTAVSEGTARVRVSTHNDVHTHQDGAGNTVDTECVVTIVEAPTSIAMKTSLEIVVGDSYTFNPKLCTADGRETSVGSCTLSASGDVIKLDGNTITGLSAGEATVTATAYNGVTATCQVTVTRRYRMFAAYCYYNVIEKGSLSFPMNNATSFQKVLPTSSIAGIKYENVGLLENPSKSKLLSGLVKAFSDSRDTDVSVVYLCSHGYNYIDVAKGSGSTHYGLQLPGYSNYLSDSDTYITSEEIFEAISTIRGQVVLVLDSCYSGQFIANMRSALDGAGGRISVMAAATNTRACYYNVTDPTRACDYFTLYMLIGAGYDMRTHVTSGSYPADTNDDGRLTFTELFNYAKKNVRTYMPKYKNKSWFHGDANQTPYTYKGNNGDLVLFQYR